MSRDKPLGTITTVATEGGGITKEFRTFDLYLAAYLQASGLEIIRTDREPTGRCTFVFTDNNAEEMYDLQKGWWSSTGMIPAQTYAQAIKTLKSMVHIQR